MIDAARRPVDALRPVVVLAILLVVAVGLRPAEARDCRDETPLPADVKLIAPGPDIAPEAARFAGAWTGAWKEQDADTICATLVVEELLPSGHARVIYGHGTWEPLGIQVPAYWRATGRVVDGVLRVLPLLRHRAAVAQPSRSGHWRYCRKCARRCSRRVPVLNRPHRLRSPAYRYAATRER